MDCIFLVIKYLESHLKQKNLFFRRGFVPGAGIETIRFGAFYKLYKNRQKHI
ncbi:hypothetical protein FEM08_02770 [Flavobacterium gilvum]|nr:hypothetical protein FEM08_02770 [Flavobacterium gilvum]